MEKEKQRLSRDFGGDYYGSGFGSGGYFGGSGVKFS